MKLFKRMLSGVLTAGICVSSWTAAPLVQALQPVAEDAVQITPDYGLEVKATDQLSRLMMASADTQTAPESSETDFDSRITGVDMENGYADVRLTAASDALLVVALHDEQTDRIVASGKTAVHAGDGSAHVEFDAMPEDYFIIRAYLVEKDDLIPMSEVYESMDYTKSEQEFYALTPADFDAEHVLQMDTASDDFAVFSDAATIVQYSDSANHVTTYDLDNGLYVIEQADETVQSLAAGDMLVLYYGEALPLMVKIGEISVDNDTVTIQEGDTVLEDLFSFVRLDSGWVEPDLSELELIEGVTIEKKEAPTPRTAAPPLARDDDDDGDSMKWSFGVDDDDNYNASYTITIPMSDETIEKKSSLEKLKLPDNVKIEASAKIEGEIELEFAGKMHFKWREGADKRTRFGAEFTTTVTPSITLSGEVSADISFLAKKACFGLGYGFNFYLDPSLHIEASAEVQFSASYAKTIGFDYDSARGDDALQPISHAEKQPFQANNSSALSFSMEAEASIFIGINLHPGIEWLSDELLDLSAEEFCAGIRATLTPESLEATASLNTDLVGKTMEVSTGDAEEEEEQHLCGTCLDGELKIEFEIKIGLTLFKILGEAALESPKLTLEPPPIHLAYFYICLRDETQHPCFEMGWGKCPHRAFLFHTKCIEEGTGRELDGASMTLTDANGKTLTVKTPDAVWLRPGSYEVSAHYKNGAARTAQFDVGYTSTSKPFDWSFTVELERNSKGAVEECVFSFESSLHDEEYVVTLNQEQDVDEIGMELEPIRYNVLLRIVDDEGNEIPFAEVLCDDDSQKAINPLMNIFNNSFLNMSFTFLNNTYNNSREAFRQDKALFRYSMPTGTHSFTVKSAGYFPQQFSVTVNDADTEETLVMSTSLDTIVSRFRNRLSVSNGTTGYIDGNGNLYMWGGLYGDDRSAFEKGPLESYKMMEHAIAISTSPFIGGEGTTSGVLTEDGVLYTFGCANCGKLGDGCDKHDVKFGARSSLEYSDTPVKIMDNVIAVNMGCMHSGALREDGSLYLWGSNTYGELGLPAGEPYYSINYPIKAMENVKAFSLGGWHSAAITEDDSLYTWGFNYNGELGNGTTESTHVPVKIMDNVAAVALGTSHSAAITKDGALYLWGDNTYGQLGNGTNENSTVPVKIMDNVAMVYLEDCVSAAIGKDGTLYTWGMNYSGNLGNNKYGSDYHCNKPTAILKNVADVGISEDHGIAITTDNRFYAWGKGNAAFYTDESNVFYHPSPKEFFLNAADPAAKSAAKAASAASSVPLAAAVSAEKQTASFTGLTPGGLYQFYCLRQMDAIEPLAAENLLALSQCFADADGNLNVTFTPREASETADLIVVGRMNAAVLYPEAFSFPELVTLQPGETLQLDGEELTTASDTVKISKDGTVTAVKPGNAAIYAMSSETPEVVALVMVTEAPAAELALGDVNGDGTVNASDAAQILIASAAVGAGGTTDLTAEQQTAADVNSDGIFNASDAAIVLIYAAATGAGQPNVKITDFVH